MYAFTLDSVASAYRLVRKMNMNWHTDRHGNEYLLRAEIVW